jgi:ATP synthase protein I
VSYAADVLKTGIRRVLLSQLVLVVGVAAGSWILVGEPAGRFSALSALYGGAITMLSTWWLGRRVQQSGAIAHTQPQRSQMVLYAGAIQRFVLTLVLLGLGLGWLDLAPVPLIVAFAAAQLGFLTNLGSSPRSPG